MSLSQYGVRGKLVDGRSSSLLSSPPASTSGRGGSLQSRSQRSERHSACKQKYANPHVVLSAVRKVSTALAAAAEAAPAVQVGVSTTLCVICPCIFGMRETILCAPTPYFVHACSQGIPLMYHTFGCQFSLPSVPVPCCTPLRVQQDMVMTTVDVKLGNRSYPIYIGNGLLNNR